MNRPAIVDTPARSTLEQLVSLAARALGAPMAVLTVVHEDREVLVSAVGVPEPWASSRGTPLAQAIGRQVMEHGSPLMIEDARQLDDAGQSGAGDFEVVAWAGVPLRTADGPALGALCVMDAVPRPWRAHEIELLQHFASCALDRIAATPGDEPGRPEVAGGDISRARLLASEQRMEAILRTSLDAIITMDAAGLVTSWSAQAERTFGWAAEEVLGRALHDHIVPERYRAAHALGLARFLASGEGPVLGRRIEIFALHRDGREFPVELTVTPVKGSEGVYFTGFLRDITDRRTAEQELRAANERFDLVARATNDAVWDLDLTTNSVWRSEGFETQFGLPPSTGDDGIDAWTSRIHPADRDRVLIGKRSAIESGGDRWADEYAVRRSDGTFADVIDRGRIIRDAGGRAIRMVGAVMDITERKRSEQAQRDARENELLRSVSTQVAMAVERKRAAELIIESETRYRLLFDANPEAMWVTDAQTNRFLAVNNTAVSRYGYSREELLGMTALDMGMPSERAEMESPLPKANRDGRTFFNQRHRRKDGTCIEVEIVSDAIEFAGRPARLVLARDTTERQHLESQLRQSQKMEAVGQLAGGIAHDFNNLLTAILGFGELLRASFAPDDERAADVAEILGAGRRAATLTQQLLAFSRKQVLQSVVLDLNDVVERVEKLLRHLIGEAIVVRTVLSADLGSVKADPAQIEQVILNLAVNARDAMPNGGSLVLETGNATLETDFVGEYSAAGAGSYVRLSVSDTGGGISPAARSRLFEPFFTTKGMGKGTGLGLSTVFGIVKQSGGFVSVSSSPGRGAAFDVFLPRVDESAPEVREAEAPEAAPRGRETVLVVEDEPALRAVARRALEESGYRVLDAGNGEEALAVLAAYPAAVDLVVTDVIMPILGGRELADRLAVVRPELRILFMSGYSDDALADRGVLGFGVAYLQKPFTPDALARRVREVLDEASRVRTAVE